MISNKIYLTIVVLIQFLGIIILRLLYEPLNRFLVKIYGCGCIQGFNTNNINDWVFILFILLQSILTIKNIIDFKKNKIVIGVIIASIVINIPIALIVYISLIWK
jgi:hypothetical protein